MASWQWSSKVGFIMAAMGSAIGLANLVRFPAYVSLYGGMAFVLIYLMFLLVLGVPVFLAEVAIGRAGRGNSAHAFYQLGRGRLWYLMGLMTVMTGLIVSAFYSVVAGWVLGYGVLAAQNQLGDLTSMAVAKAQFVVLTHDALWPVIAHAGFMLLALLILIRNLQQGLERWNPILLAMLMVLMMFMFFHVLLSADGVSSYAWMTLDWNALTPMSFLMALGHAFFTLSVGQGTMVTYGSYLPANKSSLLRLAIPVVLADTLVALIMVVIVLSLTHQAPLNVYEGLALLFQAIPVVLTQKIGAHLWMTGFFGLVLLAALTSQISALEPSIAWLSQAMNWSRWRSVLVVCTVSFLAGIPCAWSYSVLAHVQIGSLSILTFLDWLTTSLLLPLGGLFAVMLVAYRWSVPSFMNEAGFSLNQQVVFALRFLYVFLLPCLIVIIMLMQLCR